MSSVTGRTVGAEDERPDTWSVAAAKARLGAVLDRARSHGPQTITRHGRAAAVVVAPDEWERKMWRVGSLADFFAASPLRAADDLVIVHCADGPRDTPE